MTLKRYIASEGPMKEWDVTNLRHQITKQYVLAHEAEDEIERLTRECHEAKVDYARIHRLYVDAKYPESAVTNVKALETEIERLRAELQAAREATERHLTVARNFNTGWRETQEERDRLRAELEALRTEALGVIADIDEADNILEPNSQALVRLRALAGVG